MRVLRIHPDAATEAAEAVAWYENERAELGAEFAHANDAALDFLEQDIVPLSPAPGIAGSRGVKRLLMRRFPFSVVVCVRANELIVIAFAHFSRRPG